MPDPGTTSLAVWVDRFVSASSGGDARDSLEALVDGLQQPHFPEDDEEPLWHNRELLEALLQILSTGQHKGQLPMEDEGPTLVLRFYLALLPKQKTTSSSSIMVSLLNEPAPGRLVQCLLDVICDAKDETSAYTRVLALQLLQQCGTHAPSLTQSQLLEAPNGLHRLADVLRDENVPEHVRNEWILVAQQTIAQWPSCAKVWVFAELADTLLLMIQREGGLERGNVVVLDALELLETLVSADASLVDLLWQSPIVAPQLAALLDLRKGTEFRNPSAMSTSIAGGASKKPKKEDDLDAILASGSTTKKDEAPTLILPHLTASEEKVLTKVTNIIGLLLPTHETKSTVWKQHKPLGSLLWELALVMPPPPPDAKPVCALPSAAMQQTALEAIALHWNDPKTMERHNGMDRLLYLVCTGGSGSTWDEQLGLSQAALHVLRRTVSVDTAAQVVMHTLAPPMDGDPGPTVLQKLLNTVVENVNLSNEARADEDPKRRRLFLLGSLGAIGVLVEPSSTSREVLLRITSSSSLVDALLQFLEESNDDIGRLAVLRFLASWMVETPAVVQTVLASHASTTTLSSLWASSDKAIATMTGFVLGLAMEYMDGEQEETYGGWTRQNILGLISKRGVSQYTAGLEQLRKMQVPWTVCQLEWKIFWNWYISQVRVIRRRVVQELTAGSDEAEEAVDEEEETEGEAAALLKSSKATIRSLNKLVAQQSQELDELRASLTESKDTLESCKRERDVWKRRVESNPTQLDEMLTEYTRKSAEQEKLMLSLKKELQDLKDNFESTLNEKEQARTKLEQEVREWQQREQEAREDRDTMRGEMEGLSSAYASLEAEFHRQTGSTSTAAAAPTSEMSDARPSQQPEGEVSQQDQASLNELAALRAENTRLRSDAQAADEWMAMAVQRMNDIGGQNVALQQQLATLQKQLSTAPGAAVVSVEADRTALESIQSQLQAEQQNRQQLEESLRDLESQKATLEHDLSVLTRENRESSEEMVDVVDLQQKFEQERTLREGLETQLENAQSDVKTAMDSLGAAKSEREDLERTLGNMERDLNIARAEIISLTEERRQTQNRTTHALEVELAATKREREAFETSTETEIESLRTALSSKDEEVLALRGELEALRGRLDETMKRVSETEEAAALHQKIESLQQELDTAKTEIRDAEERHLSEIQAKESTIRELQSDTETQTRNVPTDATGFFGTGISESASASSDAADFFGAQSAMQDPRDEELARLRSDNEAAQEWMAKAVEHHQMLSDQVAALNTDKAALANEVKELRSMPNQSVPEDEISQLRADLEDVQRQSEQVVTEWSDRASELEATISELESNLESQQTEASEVISQWSTRCAEFESRAEQLQAEVNELAREKETMAAAVTEASRIEADLRDELAGKQFDLEHAEMLIEQEQEESRLRQEELSAEIDKLKADIASSVGSANELEATKTDYANRKAEWEERESQLQATIDQLGATLEEQQEEATSAIAGWESHCQAVEEKNSKLEKELQIALAARDEASSGLKSENGALREELEQEKMSHGELAQEIELLNGQLEEMREESEEIINEWKVRVTELEGNVEELEEILELQRQQATEAISQWEARCTALEKKASAVEAELESFKAEHIELLQAALETKENLVSSASVGPGEPVSRRASEISHAEGDSAEIIEALKAQLEDTDKVLADAVESLITERASWRADFEELQACKLELKELQEQLALEAAKNRGSDEAGPRIHLLEEQLAEEREKCTDLHVLLEKERETSATLESELLAAREESESTVSTTQQDLLAAKQEVASLRQQLQTSQLDQSRLVDALETERVKGKDGGSIPQHDFDVLAEEKMVLLQERDDLRLTVAQLEEELREANDTLQACVTDETSEKALEKMTAELRCQLEEMGTQMHFDKEVLNSHKEARIAAEAEIDQIKADLSLLLQSDRSDASDELKRMALRVAGKVQARERQDIDDLRKALERALQELESSKAAERSAVERAESSRIQATAADQELAAAKSDLMFLSQTMEEIREAEATRKAALEYRISALEDDRELLRRLHADELENMRNELAHVSMEKDRILHSLKESEKKNAALVYSTRKEHRDDSATGGSAEAELARLRLERAELLTAVAEEGSRAERRIREAVTAHASSMEADVILERELRVSAESAVEDLKSQVEGLEEELAKVREQVVSSEASEASESTKFVSEKLSSDLKRCQEQAKKLSAEKEALRSQLERSRSESKVQIAELTDKLRTVQARAHRIEREGHFASDVQAEIAKLRGESYVGDRQASGWYVSARDPAHEEEPVPRGQSVSASDAFDYVQKQKIAIQEERAMYLELLAEHDDLLALLAQQDLEKTSLQSALSRVAGNDAVEAAIQEAEENAVKQFGKYVRLAAE